VFTVLVCLYSLHVIVFGFICFIWAHGPGPTCRRARDRGAAGSGGGGVLQDSFVMVFLASLSTRKGAGTAPKACEDRCR
jgi:hypothetical protein